MHNKPAYFVGIDGGGSKCSAMLFDQQGTLLGQGIAGAANASRDFSQTLQSVVESVKLAVSDARLTADVLPRLQVGAGLAGACVPSVNKQLNAWQHPFASFKVTSDLVTACYGAHGGDDGAILIVGTGSSAARMQDQRLTQFGGHGFLLGDKGSGAWIGRSAIASTLEALDGLIPQTRLHELVLSKLAVYDTATLVQTMIGATASQFALLAPDVFHLAVEGENVALSIVTDGVIYLDKLCRRALQDNSLSLVLIGGLAASLEPWLSDRIRQRLVKAQAGPEWGAMHLLQDPALMAC